MTGATSGSGLCTIFPPDKRRHQLLWIDRLRDVVIDSGFQASFSIAAHCVGGHGQNGEFDEAIRSFLQPMV
jgi:hypothetical protein